MGEHSQTTSTASLVPAVFIVDFYRGPMPPLTTTSHDTSQQVSTPGLQREAQQPVTQQERNAAQRLRTKRAA